MSQYRIYVHKKGKLEGARERGIYADKAGKLYLRQKLRLLEGRTWDEMPAIPVEILAVFATVRVVWLPLAFCDSAASMDCQSLMRVQGLDTR